MFGVKSAYDDPPIEGRTANLALPSLVCYEDCIFSRKLRCIFFGLVIETVIKLSSVVSNLKVVHTKTFNIT